MSDSVFVPLRVVIVGGDPPARSKLIGQLNGRAKVVAEADGGSRAVELTERLRPDLVLLDVRKPPVDGAEVAARLSRATRVLIVARDAGEEVARSAVRNGAHLVHGERAAENLSRVVCDAAREAVGSDREAAGATLGLSSREAEVMDLIARGLSNGEIARTLFLSEKTVKNHINRIYGKLGAHARPTAISRWRGTMSQPSSR